MSKPDKPLFGGIKDELGSLRSELAEAAELRWRLAETELRSDLATAKRFAIWLGVVVLTILSALPLFAVCFADLLDGCCGIARAGWLAIIALGMISTAVLIGFGAYRRFRKNFTGMQETLEELREDIVWLKEWSGGADAEE